MKHTNTALLAAGLIVISTSTAAAQGVATPLPPGDPGASPQMSTRIYGPYPPNPTTPDNRPIRKVTPTPQALTATATIRGANFFVNDLEAQRAWYEQMLGMKVLRTFARDGELFEYLMGYDDPASARLALAKAPRPPGANSFSRIMIAVPDAKALADHLYGQGALIREAIPGRTFFVYDPEGNCIEFYPTNPPPLSANPYATPPRPGL